MKRCPQCNRVESDEALKFCRVDGVTLVSDSSLIDKEAGTVRLGAGSVSSEVATETLPPLANVDFNRAAPATTVLPAPPASSTTGDFRTPKKTRLNLKALAVIVTAIVAIVAAVLVISYRTRSNGPAIQSIAVMPFVNASGNADLDYLSDGMTETLIRSLSQLPNFNVKARSTVFRYKGRSDAKTIGKELGVPAILQGRFTQHGDQLTLNLELVDAQTENVIWTDQYDRKLSDLVTLQNQIARDVTSKLKIQLTSADQLKLAKNYTNDPEVYRLYLQGRFYWNKRTESEVAKAIPYFQQAVARDPNFALGYVGLADSDEDRDRPAKLDYIRRALAIDDNLAEAHASLGYQLMCAYKWVESETQLKRAIELNPNYPQAWAWNGARLMMIGRYDEALASMRRALEIDPTANGINFYYGVCLAVSGKRAEAIQQFRKLIDMDPTFTWVHNFLARIYYWDGNRAGAVEEWARSRELYGKPDDAKLFRESFASGGWEAFLREATRQRRGFGALPGLGGISVTDKEAAIQNLTQRAERGDFWLFLIKTDPDFGPLRGDSRFEALVKKFDPPK